MTNSLTETSSLKHLVMSHYLFDDGFNFEEGIDRISLK